MNLYLVTNTIDGTMYVGKTTKTIEQRWLKHLSDARRGAATHMHRAIRKYGVENFVIDPLVLTEPDFTDEQSLNDGERLMIRLLRINCRLYNLTDGGEGMSGFRHSENTRRRMSEVNKGKIMSEESRRKMSGPRRTHCKNGHERTPDNVSKARTCRACMNAARRTGLCKTHCVHGHERTASNVNKRGQCLACVRISNAARYRKNGR